MREKSKAVGQVSITPSREVEKKGTATAFFLGMAIIIASIVVGPSGAFFLSFLAFSLLMTLVWKRYTRPLVSLAMISTANPMLISRYGFTSNVLFAFWHAIFCPQYLFRIPKWIYVFATLATLGLLTSSVNWIGGGDPRSVMREVIIAYNLYWAPFIFVPVFFSRLTEESNHDGNLAGLLFFLIVPTSVVLFAARTLGSVANLWEASLHAGDFAAGFYQYRLGGVTVNFLRTEVGFILVALICASLAIVMTNVRRRFRWISLACFGSNLFLLSVTASLGSTISCILGIAGMVFANARKIGIKRILVAVVVSLFSILVLYARLSPEYKEYLTARYEDRIVEKNDDRLHLWARGITQFVEHPEGVGHTLSVGDGEISFIHNDYIAYAVSYGLFGGVAYVGLVLGLLLSFFRMRRRSMENPAQFAVYLAGFGVIVALAANGMTDHSNENKWYFEVIWSIIWYSFFCSRALEPAGKSESGLVSS